MKKILALMLVIIMSMTLFAGCGGSDDKGKNNNGDDGTIKGETYNAGNVSAFVPEGWKAFPVPDVFADEPNAMNPNALRICKGGETDLDIFSKPYVQINYYGDDTSLMTPSKDLYENGIDLAPTKYGELTWNGFTADSAGYPIAILWAENGNIQYQMSFYLGASGGTISLEDADVKTIIESIK